MQFCHLHFDVFPVGFFCNRANFRAHAATMMDGLQSQKVNNGLCYERNGRHLKPVIVKTEFLVDNGTDSDTINEVNKCYIQDGKTFEHPMCFVNGKRQNSITDEFCKDWVATTKDGTNFVRKGGMKAVDDAFEAGSVLVMSLWDDHYANMLRADPSRNIGFAIKTGRSQIGELMATIAHGKSKQDGLTTEIEELVGSIVANDEDLAAATAEGGHSEEHLI